MLGLLQKSIEPPRFEFTLTGTVGGAPFLGKPDVRFVLDLGEGRISVIDDFKVHGYCSKYGASPTKGYRLCRDGYETDKPSRSHMKEHTNYLGMNFRGLEINSGYMEGCSKEYADQLCLYGWLLGEKVGDENVVLMLDELVGQVHGRQPAAAACGEPSRPGEHGPSTGPGSAGRQVLEGHYQRPRLPGHEPGR